MLGFSTLEPLPPVSFNITGTEESTENIEVFFAWEAPSGDIGPEFFIQSYNISVMSESEYYSYTVTPTNTALNFTLNYNVNYTALAVAINCAGESEPFILSNIFFGELTNLAKVVEQRELK